MIAFRQSNWAPIVRRAWFATLCVVLLLSTTNYLGLTAIGPAHASELPLSRAWVFKNHIAASMFGALLFYQAADLALTARSTLSRAGYAGVGVVSLVNVFVMLQGRTGQVVALLLVLVVAASSALTLRRKRSPLRAGLAGLRSAAMDQVGDVFRCFTCSAASPRSRRIVTGTRAEHRKHRFL